MTATTLCYDGDADVSDDDRVSFNGRKLEKSIDTIYRLIRVSHRRPKSNYEMATIRRETKE